MTVPPAVPLIDPLDPDERLSADDMATRREEEFLAHARLAQQARAAGGDVIRQGVCSNCGLACQPQAVYCDADCRADHEQRLQRAAPTGR